MSYPRNAGTPPRISIGPVVQISDGAVQTSGVSITVVPQGGSAAAGLGTTSYENGVVLYAPTQAETNYDAFVAIAYKTGCIPASVNVVTSQSSTAGYGALDWSKLTGQSTTQTLSGTTIATSQVVASVTGAVGSVTGAVGSVTGNVGGNVAGSVGSVTAAVTAGTVSDKAGYSLTNLTVQSGATLATGTHTAQTGDSFARIGSTGSGLTSLAPAATALSTAVWTGTMAGYLDAAVSSRSSHSAADVWSVATRTLTAFSFSVTVGTNNDKTGYSLATAPLDASGTAAAVWSALLASYTNNATFGGRVMRSDQASSGNGAKVSGAGHVAADIHELQAGVITAADFAAGAIDASALAADAADEIAIAVRTNLTTELSRIDVTIGSRATQASVDTLDDYVDTEVAAIKAKTDNLPASPAAVGDIPTAVAIAAQVDTTLTASHGAGSWAVGGSGSGAYTLTLTVNDGTNPLQNATVRMVEGVNAFTGQTNASGVVAFSLDAATYSVAITKDGYSFTPTTKAVSATGSQAYSMTQITPTIPAAAGLSTGTMVAYGTTGLPLQGVVVTVQQLQGKSVDGSAYDGDAFTLTSNAQGTISHNGFVRGATYSIRRGIRGEAKSFVVPDAASFDLAEILGRD